MTEKVTVKNFTDINLVQKGLIKIEDIRSVEIEAIVDTGAAMLCLPSTIIAQLGLLYTHSRNVITANGKVVRKVYGGAWISIQGRESHVGVMENDDTTPPLIGYLILEDLDFVVNPKSQKLIGNPEHEGKWVMDLYLDIIVNS